MKKKSLVKKAEAEDAEPHSQCTIKLGLTQGTFLRDWSLKYFNKGWIYTQKTDNSYMAV